jgi:hypothetical protein
MPYAPLAPQRARTVIAPVHPGMRPLPTAAPPPWRRPGAAFAALDDRRLGQVSGWLSTAFGLAQLCAPRANRPAGVGCAQRAT